jgi:hypothetical protein
MDIGKLQILKQVGGFATVIDTVNLAYLSLHGLLSPNDTTTITAPNGEVQTIFNPYGTWNIQISAYGSTLAMFFKGHEVFHVTDSTFSSGYIGFGTYACNGAFNDVRVTSMSGSNQRQPL